MARVGHDREERTAVSGTIKKIAVSAMQPGMFVHDLGCPWLDHPMVRQRFRIVTRGVIHQVAKLGLSAIYIDISKGASQ